MHEGERKIKGQDSRQNIDMALIADPIVGKMQKIYSKIKLN